MKDTPPNSCRIDKQLSHAFPIRNDVKMSGTLSCFCFCSRI